MMKSQGCKFDMVYASNFTASDMITQNILEIPNLGHFILRNTQFVHAMNYLFSKFF